MNKVPDAGFNTIVSGLTQASQPAKPIPGHTFVGYRLRAFDEFVATFKLPANTHEQSHDKYTCEQVVRNTKPGSESYEAAKKALKHWPSV